MSLHLPLINRQVALGNTHHLYAHGRGIEFSAAAVAAAADRAGLAAGGGLIVKNTGQIRQAYPFRYHR